MKKTTEMEIKISNARITDAKATVMPNGTCKLKLEVEMPVEDNVFKENCILVEASKLSLQDKFMKYKPKTLDEKKFKDSLTEVIKNGIEDFYRPKMDPSFANKACTKIHYKTGNLPALGKSYNCWEEIVKDSEWCLGTKSQYIAFLGVLIKMLIAEGWKVSKAWDAVCNNSKKLGHYWNSDNAKYQYEDTGSREICGFFDLANTYKILAKDEEAGGFWVVGGSYCYNSFAYPLAYSGLCDEYDDDHVGCVPWLVLKK